MGQLGLGVSNSDMFEPSRVKGSLVGQCVMQVSAGCTHTACVVEGGSESKGRTGLLFVWGSNASSQLGTMTYVCQGSKKVTSKVMQPPILSFY